MLCFGPCALKHSMMSPLPLSIVMKIVASSHDPYCCTLDVILKAFGACAASQGCMNNLTFGDGTMGYYETIAGGSGAGPS